MSATTAGQEFVRLEVGDPAPWFHQRSPTNPNYAFDTAGGRYIVLCFFGSAAHPLGRAALEAVVANRRHFDDHNICFFGVSLDAADEAQGRVRDSLPGLRFFWDFDGAVSRRYGAVPRDAPAGEVGTAARQFWLVLDPTMRIIGVFPFASDGSDRDAVFRFLDGLPPVARFAGIELQAPVLFLPRVFEPEFCRHLVALYQQHGGAESGFMREVDGRTVAIHDHGHKRRKDFLIEDEALIKQTQGRVLRRIVPEILKVHQFRITRMERYIVCCYAAEDGGHFGAHRDNTTKGTAHRRFAVSINLNEDFDGGEISFPEYGPRSFKPPQGGAVVFSCSLLHAVSKVTRGRRYAFCRSCMMTRRRGCARRTTSSSAKVSAPTRPDRIARAPSGGARPRSPRRAASRGMSRSLACTTSPSDRRSSKAT